MIYHSAITTRITDGVMCSNMTWKFTLSVLIKFDKVEVCVSGIDPLDTARKLPER
jgi:hypothetical protein